MINDNIRIYISGPYYIVWRGDLSSASLVKITRGPVKDVVETYYGSAEHAINMCMCHYKRNVGTVTK